MNYTFLDDDFATIEEIETLLYYVQVKYLIKKFNIPNEVYENYKHHPEYLDTDVPLQIRESNLLSQIKNYIKNNILNSVVNLS